MFDVGLGIDIDYHSAESMLPKSLFEFLFLRYPIIAFGGFCVEYSAYVLLSTLCGSSNTSFPFPPPPY